MLKRNLIIIITLYLLIIIPFSSVADEPTQLQIAIDQFLENKIDRSLPVFTKLARQNSPEAHYYLGLIYSDTQSEIFNPKLGMQHFRIAADQHHALSMFSIGTMYSSGIGVEQDEIMAVDWYRKSKQAEDKIDASIAFYKERNDTFEKVEYKTVFQDLLQKAESGNAAIQFQVATIYDHGKIVPRDFNRALAWYQKAADNNYAEAQYIMGYFYCMGIGLEQDSKKSNDWFEKSNRSARCSE